jgi:ABC-type Fe3+ transport system permease subunit
MCSTSFPSPPFKPSFLRFSASLWAFPLGWFLTRYRFPGKGLARAFTLAPFVLPPITVSLGFFLFFGNTGYLNNALRAAFGLREPPLRLLYSLWAIVLAHAFYNAPVFARFIHAAWSSLDPSLEEACAVLGVSRPRAFFTVTLPLLLPAIFSAAALVFVLCFLSFAIPLSLGGARFATVEVGIYLYARVYLDFSSRRGSGIGTGFGNHWPSLFLRAGKRVFRRPARANPSYSDSRLSFPSLRIFFGSFGSF